MVDMVSSVNRDGEGSRIKSLMERTPSILKSKFLSVLGNSNELLNGISNKLDINLSLSGSDTNTEYTDDDDEECCSRDDDTVDISSIDFETRRVKERRAHEEILSGRFRHPNLAPKLTKDGLQLDLDKPLSSSSDSNKSSPYSISNDSKSPNRGGASDPEDEKTESLKMNGHVSAMGHRSSNPAIDVIPPLDGGGGSAESGGGRTPNVKCDKSPPTPQPQPHQPRPSNSSTLTSLNDLMIPLSASLESSDLRIVMRSESEVSVPSWCSSMSLENPAEEVVKEFMKQFVNIVFTSSSSIGLELKSEFGQKARLDSGRLWFARFVNAQRAKSKRVDETTFYSLVQYFAIILFECAESKDYSPAKNLMNMCFTFYHEIEVPGCEPYREYLFTYLREQPIWHTLEFWNAAFADALKGLQDHRPMNGERRLSSTVDNRNNDNVSLSCNATHSTTPGKPKLEQHESVDIVTEEQKFQHNITFGQLGTFTCNMHAFGLSKDLCIDFLQRQAAIASLPKEQEKILRDNIKRMYLETDKWGA
ncbi:unnamed protein product [Hermetia illucens]|uniref:SBF1/SBF2 domain-containing protein n=1 Tax=Hermetia illucens TaxID=343691 RepID=A0A7R8YVJ8_HERIL|nr:uncharacterized protein KIAA0513 isoform X1 [Hermetia illucens]CAD7086404.1 unnamed protein product [Hermetia illucens]